MEATLSKELREILNSRDGRRRLKEFLLKSARGNESATVIELGERRYTVESIEGPSVEPSKAEK